MRRPLIDRRSVTVVPLHLLQEGNLPFQAAPKIPDLIPLFMHDLAQILDRLILMGDMDFEIPEPIGKICVVVHDGSPFRPNTAFLLSPLSGNRKAQSSAR